MSDFHSVLERWCLCRMTELVYLIAVMKHNRTYENSASIPDSLHEGMTLR